MLFRGHRVKPSEEGNKLRLDPFAQHEGGNRIAVLLPVEVVDLFGNAVGDETDLLLAPLGIRHLVYEGQAQLFAVCTIHDLLYVLPHSPVEIADRVQVQSVSDRLSQNAAVQVKLVLLAQHHGVACRPAQRSYQLYA